MDGVSFLGKRGWPSFPDFILSSHSGVTRPMVWLSSAGRPRFAGHIVDLEDPGFHSDNTTFFLLCFVGILNYALRYVYNVLEVSTKFQMSFYIN
jgi:hypothetical protein